MKTAVISDLHLGATTGSDVLRDPETRAVLFEELRGAERLVLLGDAIELRDRPLGAALEHALPVLAELGAAVGDIEVVLSPATTTRASPSRCSTASRSPTSRSPSTPSPTPRPAPPPRSPQPSPPPACGSATPASGCATTSSPPTATTWTCT